MELYQGNLYFQIKKQNSWDLIMEKHLKDQSKLVVIHLTIMIQTVRKIVVLQVKNLMKKIVKYIILQDDDKVKRMMVKINYSRNLLAVQK